jgi:DNA repair protein RadC
MHLHILQIPLSYLLSGIFIQYEKHYSFILKNFIMEQETGIIVPIVAEIELSYTPNVKPSMRPKINSAEDAYKLFLQTWDTSKIEFVEQFKVMLLNRANRVLGICTLTSGSTVGTIADPKQVFSVALLANAINIILAHNHPSGSVVPSASDIDLTAKMKMVGEFMQLKVLDHIIVCVEGYYSFAHEGTL